MNDHIDEDILAYDVSDEELEAVAGMERRELLANANRRNTWHTGTCRFAGCY